MLGPDPAWWFKVRADWREMYDRLLNNINKQAKLRPSTNVPPSPSPDPDAEKERLNERAMLPLLEGMSEAQMVARLKQLGVQVPALKMATWQAFPTRTSANARTRCRRVMLTLGASLVHGDIKPGNIWLEVPAAEDTEAGHGDAEVRTVSLPTCKRIRVVDFGLARPNRNARADRGQ